MKKGGLGRGLSALIPGAREESGLLEVPVAAIAPNPRQPRGAFEGESLTGLARSIQQVGVLQPIVVRPRNGGYELVAGERRLRAAKMAGLATIPAVVRQTDDTEALREALIENLHREDLAPLELAAAFQELIEELSLSQDELAERLGFSRPHISNTIRLLQLPDEVQGLLAEGKIQAGHGRALLALSDPEAQTSLALRIAAEDLSVRQVEEVARAYAKAGRTEAADGAAAAVRSRRPPDPRAAEVEEILSEELSTRVRVQMGRRKGKVVVEFGSAEDLDRIVTRIVSGP